MLVKSEVKFHVYPEIPDYCDHSPEQTRSIWILYPSKSAQTLPDIVQELTTDPNSETSRLQFSSYQDFCQFLGLKTLVVLDGTWSQMHAFLTDPRIQNARFVRYVKLNEYRTCFWRPQGKMPQTCLATIEALFYFLKELQMQFEKFVDSSLIKSFNYHEFDDILYFYDFMFRSITKWIYRILCQILL